MKKFLLLLFSTSILACNHNSDDKYLKTTSELVQTLSSDSMEGRRPGTSGFERAAKFVETYLALLKIEPFFGGSYRDTIGSFKRSIFNIVGVIDGGNPTNDYILIGAHLDHFGKFDAYEDSVFNGANDNASGVTAVLQIAKELKKHKFDKKVIIAFFTLEEFHKQGSKHLAKKLRKENIKLLYMINFEMIGCPLTSSPYKAYITGFDKSNFAEVANKLLKDEFIIDNQEDSTDRLFRASDNYPFYLEFKIPSHSISTSDSSFKYLHSPADDYSQINVQHMDLIIQKTSKLILALLQDNSELFLKN